MDQKTGCRALRVGRRVRSGLLPCLLLPLLGASPVAFTSVRPTPSRSTRAKRTARASGGAFLPLEAVTPALSAYADFWKPLFIAAKESGLASEYLLHWGHGAAMGTVLLAMGGYGTFLGWQIRQGNGGEVYALSLGQAARELHPTLMGLALFLFFLGGQGGLVLLATAGQPVLQSAHSSTAVIGLSLMAVQAGLGLTMGSEDVKRTAHAVLGTSVMVVLLLHLYFGIDLGGSF